MKFSDHPVDILKQLIVDVGGDVDPHTETQLRDLCNQMVCSSCGAHQPQWTRDKPKSPGYYCMKSGPDLHMVKIYNDGCGLRVLYHGSSWEDDVAGIGNPLWYGPVSLPAQKD